MMMDIMSNKQKERPKLQVVNKKLISKMGRRQFIKTLVGAGFGTGTALQLTAQDVRGAASDQVPIVFAHVSEDTSASDESLVAESKYVPADWYNDLQHARDVGEQVKQTYGGRPGIVGIGIEPGKYGGDNALIHIDVLPQQVDEWQEIIPSQIGGVPIEIRGTAEPKLGCNTSDFGDTVPGGVRGIGDANEGYGTLASRMYDNAGRKRFATSHHLFKGKGSDLIGKSLWHPRKSKPRIGKVVRAHCYDDFILAAPRNGHTPQRRIEDANPERVRGQFSRDGLADLAAGYKFIKKVGVRTCKTRGRTRGANYTLYAGQGCLPRDGQVVWGQGREDFYEGDSGSVCYRQHPDNSYQLVAGINSWYGGGQCGGTSAWSIRRRHSYHF